MRDLSFTLDTNDIQKISDLLNKHCDNPEMSGLAGLFMVLKSHNLSASIKSFSDEHVHPFHELLNDLDLEIDEEVEPDESWDDDVVREDPKPRPRPTPEPTPEPPTEPPTEPVKPPTEPITKVLAGWDDRVPRPTVDPDLVKKEEEGNLDIPRPFNPQPNGSGQQRITQRPPMESRNTGVPAREMEPRRPIDGPPPPRPMESRRPTPPTPEPDLERDGVCDHCGGFTPDNPHSDPNMNCDCGSYNPEPEPTPSGGWDTTGSPDVWRT